MEGFQVTIIKVWDMVVMGIFGMMELRMKVDSNRGVIMI